MGGCRSQIGRERSSAASDDADTNGALNHEADLYPLPFDFYHWQLNRTGVFWNETGLLDSYGQAFAVPVAQKTVISGGNKTP